MKRWLRSSATMIHERNVASIGRRQKWSRQKITDKKVNRVWLRVKVGSVTALIDVELSG